MHLQPGQEKTGLVQEKPSDLAEEPYSEACDSAHPDSEGTAKASKISANKPDEQTLFCKGEPEKKSVQHPQVKEST